jgi:hypothetical protein
VPTGKSEPDGNGNYQIGVKTFDKKHIIKYIPKKDEK